MLPSGEESRGEMHTARGAPGARLRGRRRGGSSCTRDQRRGAHAEHSSTQEPGVEDTCRGTERAAKVSPRSRCCNDQLNPVSTSRCATPNAWARPAQSRPSGRQAIRMTMPSLRRSTRCSKPNSCVTVARGRTSTSWRSRSRECCTDR